MKHIVLFSITVYQLFFPVRGYCRFYPTCSEYAKIVINEYGLLKGVWLTILRLLRCQPFTKQLVASR